jgi:hypothetical protein
MEVLPYLYLKVKNHIKWYLVTIRLRMEESSYKLALFIARLLNVASISLVLKLPQDPTLRKFLTVMILIPIIKQETLF